MTQRWLGYVLLTALLVVPTGLRAEPSTDFQRLEQMAAENGSVKVMVTLDVKNIKQLTADSTKYKTAAPGERFPADALRADEALEAGIETTTNTVLYGLNGKQYTVTHTFRTLPFLALDVSAEALAILPTLPEVLFVEEDRPLKLMDTAPVEKGPLKNPFQSVKRDGPMLDTSVDLIGASDAWGMGYTGSGWYVAILDTGIRGSHQFFQGKTIREACFSADGHCPNNGTSMFGAGAAAHYSSSYDGWDHGTHVAGIAAGQYGSLAGVAKDSDIIAVQVFSRFSADDCDGSPCVMSYHSDQVKGLEYVYSLRGSYSIAAANMSLGGGAYSDYCDSASQKAAIDNLKAVNIATVIATGNNGYCSYVGSPACISSAVAVGASDDNDAETSFNNWNNTLLEFFAPGSSIYSSIGSSDSDYYSWNGTSMATPHVTGAWALLRQAKSTASVDAVFSALESTGTPISSSWCGGDPKPRINVDDAITELTGGGPPEEESTIALNRTSLYFAAVGGGAATSSQTLQVENTGGGTMNWTAGSDSAWLTVSPPSGTEAGTISVSVSPSGYAAGVYNGYVSVSSTDADNSPQAVSVRLTVISAAQDTAPFGEFATPMDGANISSSVPVTGWVLDDVETASVKIYRGTGNDMVYIGDALMVEGARPDVETAYPGYPKGYLAGWGYMMLTNFLPSNGNGTFTLSAVAEDNAGHRVTLGSHTVTVDNANAVKPFGAIDNPAPGGEASGTSYRNSGWVLTPPPNKVPEDGSTINVFVDGVNLGRPVYNVYRADIAGLFPTYLNSGGAHAYMNIDMTAFANGVHTIAWTAVDDAGNADGIGSRYFAVQNAGERSQGLGGKGKSIGLGNAVSFDSTPVLVKKGFGPDAKSVEIHVGGDDVFLIEINELDRLELHLSPDSTPKKGYHGYAVVGDSLRDLPIGSTLDTAHGVFSWQPGPGFVGEYDLVFAVPGGGGKTMKKQITVNIIPRR